MWTGWGFIASISSHALGLNKKMGYQLQKLFDFIIALLMKIITGVKANYIAKHTLFKPPFGFIFKAVKIARAKSFQLWAWPVPRL